MTRQTLMLIVLLFATVGLADVGRIEVVETDSVEKVPGGGYRVFPGAKRPANMAPAPKPVPKADPVAKHPATPLPGSSLSVTEALRDGYAFVTVCHATAEAKVWGKPQGAEQTFARVEKLLAGKIAAGITKLRVAYFLVDAGGRREQPIKKGQRIIWIIRKRGRSCLGVKAVPDTPANREAVAAAAKKADEEIEAAINALMAVLRLRTPKGWQVTLARGQVQPQGLLKAEGVSISMEPKVAGPGKGQGTFLWLMSSTYQIPRQILSLQMAFWRGRRVLYRSADAKMPSEAIRAALNATARAPGAIDVQRRKAGVYVAGKWKYTLRARGGFGSAGALLYMGIPIHADYDRVVRTPWGYMRNFPARRDMRGPMGWLLAGFDRFDFQSRDEFVISFDATKIDAKASRLYVSGPWAYSSGCLTCGGKAVPTPKNVGDYYVTPWGKIFWTGRRSLWAIGYKGKAGKELPPPASLPQTLEPQRKKRRAQAQEHAPVPAGGPWAQLLNLPEFKKKAAERAKLLKENLDTFNLHLAYVDKNRKPTHAVTLSVPKPAPVKPGGNKAAVQVTKEQAAAIIDSLQKNACLGWIVDPRLLPIISRLGAPMAMPHLHVRAVAGKHSFETRLGIWTWANGLVGDVRKPLPGDGPAAKELDKLTKALGAQRKKWAKDPFAPAPALQGGLGAALQQLLKSQVARFVLEVRYDGPQDNVKPFFSLTLSVPGMAGGLKRAPWAPAVQISKAQALKIIDHLHATGTLNKPGNPRTKGLAPPKGPTYSLIVKGLPQLPFHEPLGWDLNMLERLDALRKVLDGDAGKAMDKLLATLEPQRKKWQKAAAGKPAAKPAVKWGKAVGGLVCGISAFKKNVQLGVPYEIEVSIKNISKGDVLLLKRRLFGKEPLNDRLYFMQADKTYREFFTHDLASFAVGPVRRQDFVLLKPGDIYKFTHGMLVLTSAKAADLKKVKGGLGLMGLTREGTYLMQVRYQPWFTLAKGVDLGGLKPWKGVLLSAPVEVVVRKAPAKQPAQVHLSLQLERSTYHHLEDIWATVRLTTESKTGIVLRMPGWVEASAGLRLEIKDSNGKVMEFIGPVKDWGGPLPTVRISKAKPLVFPLKLKWLYKLDKPGRYSVRALYVDKPKMELSSKTHKIHLVKPDAETLLTRYKPVKQISIDLIKATLGKEQAFLVVYRSAGSVHQYRRLPADCGLSKMSRGTGIGGGNKYWMFAVALAKGRTLLVRITRYGPGVFTQHIPKDASELTFKMDLKRQERILVAEDGTKYLLEPPPPAASQPGKAKPPTRVAKRAKLLTKHVDQFTLVIRYFGPQDEKNPRISLTLRVPKVPPEARRLAHWPAVQISKAQALKIIAHLADEGFLARAADISKKKIAYPKGPAYTMTGPGELYEVLGWDLNMLKRLDALRKVLDGDAGKAMDKLLAALEPQRKKWQKPAAGKPAAKPPVKWGKAVNGLVCGISAFKKNVQLGVPYEIEVRIKNVSKRDILLLSSSRRGESLSTRVILARGGKQYREYCTADSKSMLVMAGAEDFARLKPSGIHKFTHRTLIVRQSHRKKPEMGIVRLTEDGKYQMQIRYLPWPVGVAKGTDLGGLKPWKGVLLSAPVEVVVAKAPAKGKAS